MGCGASRTSGRQRLAGVPPVPKKYMGEIQQQLELTRQRASCNETDQDDDEEQVGSIFSHLIDSFSGGTAPCTPGSISPAMPRRMSGAMHELMDNASVSEVTKARLCKHFERLAMEQAAVPAGRRVRSRSLTQSSLSQGGAALSQGGAANRPPGRLVRNRRTSSEPATNALLYDAMVAASATRLPPTIMSDATPSISASPDPSFAGRPASPRGVIGSTDPPGFAALLRGAPPSQSPHSVFSAAGVRPTSPAAPTGA